MLPFIQIPKACVKNIRIKIHNINFFYYLDETNDNLMESSRMVYT